MVALFSLALPIIIQNGISSSLNAIDVMMLGQMGDDPVAGVGLANQVFFLLTFMLFGISSGAGIFSAQYWGKGDLAGIRRVLGLALMMTSGAALFFMLAALVIPSGVLSIYTNDAAVIATGTGYLRIVGWSYLLTAVSFSFSATLRATGNVRLPMAASVLAISLKTGLSYVLIFGKLGAPAMGVQGAALATLLARAVECGVLLFLTYRLKTPAAARPAELLDIRRDFLAGFLKLAMPVALNETLWSLGISVYNLAYAHIGTESIAAVNIAATIEGLAFVIFIGISDATGILIGNKIGAGNRETAFDFARRSLGIATLVALAVGGLIIALRGALLQLYAISPEALDYANRILLVMGFTLWIRISNMTIIVGVLRSGGDTRFGLFVDLGTVWAIGVPLALLGVFVLHLPVYWVYLMVMTEEVIKYVFALTRFFSRRWMRDVTALGQPAP
ncbi:MATE family efflux transporter [bacterium]|nr:MAG: MATE family efflux transporter [bacterium]